MKNISMVKLILLALLPTTMFMRNSSKELNITDLVQCVGIPFDQQKVFDKSGFINPSKSVLDKYILVLIKKSVKNPRQFTLFGIPADEIHFAMNSLNKILAVFVRLDNQDLVKKMEKSIGDKYMAAGASMADEDVPPSYYLWDYKGACVSLSIDAHKRLFVNERLPDDGVIIFFNCDPTSYLNIPPDWNKDDQF